MSTPGPRLARTARTTVDSRCVASARTREFPLGGAALARRLTRAVVREGRLLRKVSRRYSSCEAMTALSGVKCTACSNESRSDESDGGDAGAGEGGEEGKVVHPVSRIRTP